MYGYSRLMGDNDEATLRTLTAYRQLVDTQIARHHGRFVNSVGDSILAEFASVIDAVTCAVAIQRRLKVENAELNETRRMEFRFGVNLGDVMVEGEQIYGDGVNVAARLESLATPGGICISRTVHENIRSKLPLAFEDLGDQTVKNIAEPVRTFRVLLDPADSSIGMEPPIPTSRKKSLVALAGAGVIALAALAYLATNRRSSAPETFSASTPRVIHSIAVLPLDNYSGDPNQEYFADGMTDELTTDLAKISALRVISRSSVMQFKGEHRRPVPEIAKTLNVDAVVEGSVLRSGDKVRISAQLIDAPADKHLWAKSFERDSRDVLAMQDELAAAIAKEINVQLTPTEQSRLTSAPTVIPAAHDAYLKGRYFFSHPSDENLKKAIAQFDEAVRLDPNFAPAYSGLSDAYLWAGFNEGVLTSAEAMPEARATAEKALQLDDTSAEAHTSLGMFREYEFDWAGCESEFRRAIALNPNYAFAHDQFALALVWQGRLDEGAAESRRAVELDPLSPEIATDMAYALAWQGKFDAAKEQERISLSLDPTLYYAQFVIGWIDVEAGKLDEAIPELQKAAAMESPAWVAAWLGYAYGASGDRVKALAMIEELKHKAVHGFAPPFNLAIVYLGMGDHERALDGLETAYAANSQWVALLKMDRIFDPLRSEPRFIALLKKVHLDK